MTTGTGKVTQAAARRRLKEVAGVEGAEAREERDALEVCVELMKERAAAAKAVKKAQAELDEKVLAQYSSLAAGEIAEIVVRDKWMASVAAAVEREVERVTAGLVDRVRELEGRYAEPLAVVGRRVEELEARVQGGGR